LKERPKLLKRLMDYGNSDFYPFHMPGHKRQYGHEGVKKFPNPFSIDITEIDGFDNLHRPEGILKDSLEWAADVYGSDKTYYLVNGSSCGILSAISAAVSNRGTILMSRNCHKSAYHGVFLNQLEVKYIYPQIILDMGIQGGILAEDVEELLKKNPEIEAVLVVSPTYDGVVSDIRAIAEVVHRFHLPLIVDEAHGAHFTFGKNFSYPVSALELGADVVIQSLHKTLPSLTQTAIMHVKKGFINIERLERYVQMYQTSSPSYVFMASIENCICYMEEEGMNQLGVFSEYLLSVRSRLERMENLKLLSNEIVGQYGVFDYDNSKIIVSTRNTGWSGGQVDQILREEYHLEMEMCGADYVTAITTLEDTKEGLERLCMALLEMDTRVGSSMNVAEEDRTRTLDQRRANRILREISSTEECRCSISQAMDGERHKIRIQEAMGKVSAEFVYLYPPGIPIVVPGEVLSGEIIEVILKFKDLGLHVQGMEDEAAEFIYVLDEM
jgi:arginine/lysine/ornithine decarboxylase